MACLIALSPLISHREYELADAETVAGRDALLCHIVVTGETISRRHLRIESGGSGYILHDMNSTNGVFVNRRRIDGQCGLRDGDVIGMGGETADTLLFRIESGRGLAYEMMLPAKAAWTVGRGQECDIPLASDPIVSSLHATVRRVEDGVEIADEKSLNGTWVNGRRVRRAKLTPVDSVMIGSTILRLQCDPAGALKITRRECRDEIALEAVGLTLRVKTPGSSEGRKILDRIALAIRPGEFVGLLGPSGAGKSTLLKALNGYQPPQRGCVLLNEMPLYQSYAMFRNSIGYVPQDDIVHAELTVRDSLEYIARLRLPQDMARAERDNLIETTIETLGLSHVRGSRIQDLSGGQRKRVSIGCELITHPSLLFLDEPTSGMDPCTEERLMHYFQGMARHGATVLITTHILYNLAMLDRVVIMARGRLVFFGRPAEAMNFFTLGGRPIDRPTQIFEALEADPAIAPPDAGSDPKDVIAEHYQQKYLQSEYCRENLDGNFSTLASDLSKAAGPASAPAQAATLPSATPLPASGHANRQALEAMLDRSKASPKGSGGGLDLFSPHAFGILTRRQFAVKMVSLKQTLFYLMVPLILALVTLTLKTQGIPAGQDVIDGKTEIRGQLRSGPFDIGDPVKALLSPEGAADPRPAEDVVYALKHEGVANLPVPLSVILMFVMTAVFTGTLMACLDISTERPIFQRERMAGQQILSYLASKLPFLFLATALQMTLFMGICYLKPDLRMMNPAGVYLALVAMAWTASAMGLLLSALDPSAGRFSVILAIVAVLPQLIFSGGLGPDFFKGMPAAMQWISDAFPARWGIEMLTMAFYHQPDHESLNWISDFIPGTIGFDFTAKVYLRNAAVLTGQGIFWLALCAWRLKRGNRI